MWKGEYSPFSDTTTDLRDMVRDLCLPRLDKPARGNRAGVVCRGSGDFTWPLPSWVGRGSG